jgi:hypothetical protein
MTAAAQLTAVRHGERHPLPEVKLSLLVFHLSGTVCALPLAALREIVPLALLSRPLRPALQEYVKS